MQILCALRDVAFGSHGLNELTARRPATRFGIDANHACRHPVIITRSDYARGLFNGDVGIAPERVEGLHVWFELGDRDTTYLRNFSLCALPDHERA